MSGQHLVVIDMQRVFADVDSPWATPDFGAILPTVAGLVDEFGEAVTCTRFVAPERPTGAWREYYAVWPFALQPPDAPLWDVVPELGSTGPTVDATTFSKWGPALAERVGDATMVLCGVSTDCCVLSTTIAAPLDFYGLNYYNPTRVADPAGIEQMDVPEGIALPEEMPFALVPIEDRPRTAFGWPVAPEGLTEMLLSLTKEYDDALPPLYVTENGCAYDDVVSSDGGVHDLDRVRYLDGHLRAIADALAGGADVRGYYTWSLLDNWEWAEGFTKRFGLVHVDYATQRRTPKDSYRWFAGLIASQPGRRR